MERDAYFAVTATYVHHMLSAWELLDTISPGHKMRHNLAADLVFGSYVTGHLPRTHPLVADTTHDDRSLEGILSVLLLSALLQAGVVCGLREFVNASSGESFSSQHSRKLSRVCSSFPKIYRLPLVSASV